MAYRRKSAASFLNVSLLGCGFAAAALSIAISTTRCAWHCGGWSTSRRPDFDQDDARRIAANIVKSPKPAATHNP